MVEMTRAFHAKKNERALAIHKILLPAIDIMFCEGNPGPLKAAFEILGLSKNILRAPLAPVTSENYALIKSTLFLAKSQLASLLARSE